MSHTLQGRDLLEWRKRAGLSQEDAARKLKIAREWLSKVENEKAPVSSDLYLRFQEAQREVEVTIAEDRLLNDPPGVHGVAVRDIPVISWSRAGEARSYDDMARFWHDRVATTSADPRAFGLAIEGDSMEPKFFAGDRVVCEPSQEPRDGRPVVAKFADDAVQLRVFNALPGGLVRLASLRPEIYATKEYPRSAFSWIFPVRELVRSV